MRKLNNSLKFNEGEEPENDKPHIHYVTDGKDRWCKVEYKRQCPEGVFMCGRCQGVEGHKGVHWRYDASGSFHYDDNDADPSEGGCSGTIPPEHASYRSPKEMAKHFFREHRVETELTDPDEIARLKSDKLTEGESSSRPVDMSKISSELAEELNRRLDESKSSKPKRQWWAFWRSKKPKID